MKQRNRPAVSRSLADPSPCTVTQTSSPRLPSPASLTHFKPAPHMAWKTGGLFDEEELPAEMQDADIGQMFDQLPNDINTMIGYAGPYSANETMMTIDWTSISDSKPSTSAHSWTQHEAEKKVKPRAKSFILSTPAVAAAASLKPINILDLDLPVDLLQSLIAESGLLDDLGVGSLPTPPPLQGKNPLGLRFAPFPAAADHATYVKRRRLSSESGDESTVAGDFADTVMCKDEEGGHDEKYLERRRKNNIASRRSRELRKRKMETTEQRAQELEAENKALRARVEELERTGRLMKELLLQRLAPHK